VDQYTHHSTPGAGGYTTAPAQPLKAKRYRRGPKTLFQTSRRVRYLVCAAIVALGAVTVPTVYHLATGRGPQVLTALRTLPAGHVIVAGDLGTVDGSYQSASAIPASMRGRLLGHQLQLEVPQGALVAPGDFGPFPPAGMTVVPVAVKPGQYPPTLTGGDLVAVFPTPGTDGAGVQPAAHAAASGRVVQVQPAGDSSGTAVVLLEVATTQAPAVAQAPGAVLVALDAAGDLP
jgi:hypothetical protein